MTISLSVTLLTTGNNPGDTPHTVSLDVDESLEIPELRRQLEKKFLKDNSQLPPPPIHHTYDIDKLYLLNPSNGTKVSLAWDKKKVLSPATIITIVSGDDHPSDYEKGILNENDSLLKFMNLPCWTSAGNGTPNVAKLAPASLSGEVPKNYNYEDSQWEEEEHADRFIRVFDTMDISFRRTLRMPDDGKTHYLPPDFGTFPLYNVESYPGRFPKIMEEEGGVFFAMYQREAMYISFKTKNYRNKVAVKISCGGVNAITGMVEGQEEQVKDGGGEKRQDYIVLPGQDWVDGFCTQPGVVRQFVAMPLGSGYTVESQKTSVEVKCGFEFQFTPSYNQYLKSFSHTGASPDNFKALEIWKCPRELGLGPGTRLEMRQYEPITKTYLILGDYLQHKGHDGKLHLELHTGLRNSFTSQVTGVSFWTSPMSTSSSNQMGLAPGGRIIQDIRRDQNDPRIWAVEQTRSIKVHILNSTCFEEITHMLPPCTTVSAEDYARKGLPFFYLEEEPEARVEGGQFEGVKSVGQMDKEMLKKTESAGRDAVDPLKPKICGACKKKLCDCVIRPCNHTFCNTCVTSVASVPSLAHATCPECNRSIKRVVGFSAPMNLPGEKTLRLDVPVRILKKGSIDGEGRPVFESVVKMRF